MSCLGLIEIFFIFVSILQIYYLDHLSRVPESWGMRPRLKAWSQEKISATIKDKKKKTKRGLWTAPGELFPFCIVSGKYFRFKLSEEC